MLETPLVKPMFVYPSDVWDRQKRWELKREVLFEATKIIAAADDALCSLSVVYSVWKKADKNDPTTESSFKEKAIQAGTKWLEAATNLDQARLLVSLVCGKEVYRLLLTLTTLMRTVGAEISVKKNPEMYKASIEELLTQSEAITAAMRKEIGMEESN
jgi:hypothetical protein